MTTPYVALSAPSDTTTYTTSAALDDWGAQRTIQVDCESSQSGWILEVSGDGNRWNILDSGVGNKRTDYASLTFRYIRIKRAATGASVSARITVTAMGPQVALAEFAEEGTVTLVAGTSGSIATGGTASSKYIVVRRSAGGEVGFLDYQAGAGSVVIRSDSSADTSVVEWYRTS